MKLILLLALWLNTLGSSRAFLSSDIFSTGDERILSSFCSTTSAELITLGNLTYTHEKMIVAGIKQSVINYFVEMRPDMKGKLKAESSLSDLFLTYYGDCASPLKFVSAVKDIVDSSDSLDSVSGQRDNPIFSFDAEMINETQSELESLYSQIITLSTNDLNFFTARQLLGKSLRIIQRFYSHSNWVELGNTDILSVLGKPGGVIENIAGHLENTCSGSTVTTTKLTSGYCNDILSSGENVTIPAGVEKCRHGGTRDSSMPGINKDTPDSCYSPHGDMHKTASDLATEATIHYMEYIRGIIGNSNFTQLMDLAVGSPLVVVIDTTGSMGIYIDAVKEQVKAIVDAANAGGVGPSTYVLAPFNDPGIGPPLRTQDTDLFLAAVNALRPKLGGDLPEKVWGGIQLALVTAPAYSDVFVFTDAVGKDGELMDPVFALAKELSARISFVTSLVSRGARRIITTTDDYRLIANVTGGLLIPATNKDVDKIAGLLSKSIETSKSTIAYFSLLTGTNTLKFPIDNFWRDPSSFVEIKIVGGVSSAVLRSASGSHSVDILNNTDTALNINIFIEQEGLLYFSFTPTSSEEWFLDVSSVLNYAVQVDATCTYTFMADLRYLDIGLNHPAYVLLPGQPISGSYPTIKTIMVGLQPGQVSELSKIRLVTTEGASLTEYALTNPTEILETFLTDTIDSGNPLPTSSFLFRLEGLDSEGNEFWRTITTPIEPATLKVEVTTSSASLSGYPDSNVTTTFKVWNLGAETDVNITLLDTQVFLKSFTPKYIRLATNTSVSVTASFYVSKTAKIGSKSIITCTAKSQLDRTQNYAILPMTVVGRKVDNTEPRLDITSNGTGLCEAATESTCEFFTWTVNGTMEDLGSGILTLRLDGGANATLEMEKFTSGTTNLTHFTITGSCCGTSAAVTAIDMSGNAKSLSIGFELKNDTTTTTTSTTTSTIAPTTTPAPTTSSITAATSITTPHTTSITTPTPPTTTGVNASIPWTIDTTITTPPVTTTPDLTCCSEKMVGDFRYILLDAMFDEAELYGCMDTCLYRMEGDTSKTTTCFGDPKDGDGGLPVSGCVPSLS